jgi:hypothetical protein
LLLAGFLLGLIISSEDGSRTYLRIVLELLYLTTWRYIDVSRNPHLRTSTIVKAIGTQPSGEFETLYFQ